MNLTQEDWAKNLQQDGDSAVVLDVRTEDEYNQGHLKNSLNLDIYKGQGFIYNLEELDKNKKYYVYCRSGGRSEQACSIMDQLGFSNAYNLAGGIMEWKGEIIN